jgi:mono/diheme cytochrome c family protein
MLTVMGMIIMFNNLFQTLIKPSNMLITIGLFVIIALGLMCWKIPHLRPVLVPAYGPAQLVFLEGDSIDIGNVIMDSKVSYPVWLSNNGGRLLHIKAVEPSCGCTVAKPSSEVIAPGKSAILQVTLDTSLKLGTIEKTIDVVSNDADEPRKRLTLHAMALAPKGAKTHNGQIQVKDRLVLFKGECASCHVQRGEGKMGEELFLADCGMCHGMNAAGGVAPGLLKLDHETPQYRQWVRDTIANGMPQNPSMPPFSKQHGGPLSDAQIDSLVNYLAYLAKSSQTSPVTSTASH